jgi:hypothetical protein
MSVGKDPPHMELMNTFLQAYRIPFQAVFFQRKELENYPAIHNKTYKFPSYPFLIDRNNCYIKQLFIYIKFGLAKLF